MQTDIILPTNFVKLCQT